MLRTVVYIDEVHIFCHSGARRKREKIEKTTIFKANLSLVLLTNLVKAVPNNKVRTFIFKNIQLATKLKQRMVLTWVSF